MILTHSHRALVCGVASLIGLAVVPKSFAVDRQWNVAPAGTGDFALGSNWTPSFATTWGAADRPIISNGGTSILSGGTITLLEIWVGQNGTGTATGNIQQTGGSLTTTDGLVLGRQGSAVGTYTMTGGSLSLTNLRLGGGTATASGTMTVSGLGTAVTSTGTGHTSIGSPGIGSLTLADSATWTHGGANAFLVGSDNNVSGANGGTGTLTVQNGASMLLSGTANLTVGRNNLGNGTLNVDGGSLTLNGATAALNLGALNGGTTGGTGTLNFSSGSITTSAVKVLEGTGTLNLNGGVLTTGSITEGTGSGVVHFNGTTVRAAVDNADFFAGFEATDLDAQGGGLKMDTNGHAVSISQGVGGSGGLAKTGAGTLTLLGANTYAGTTTVSQGKLVLSGNVGGGGATIVESGATLTGGGSMGPATIKANGILAPGAGLGAILAGSTSFESAGILQLEIAATNGDTLISSGTVSLGSSINLDITLVDQPILDSTFTLVDSTGGILGYDSGGRFNYLGNDLDEGEHFLVVTEGFTQEFSISYAADGGTDVTIQAVVPEPTALTAALSAGGLLLGLARRRRRSVASTHLQNLGLCREGFSSRTVGETVLR